MPNVNLRNLLLGAGGQLQQQQQRGSQQQQALIQALMQAKIKQQYAPPQKWVPTTQQQTLGFERAKAQIKPPKLTSVEKFRTDLIRARNRQITWNELKSLYPDKLQDINIFEKQATPIAKHPGFVVGGGPRAALSRLRAPITPKVQAMVDSIKSQADYEEFLMNIGSHIKSGDWSGQEKAAVLEYFGKR